MAIMWEAGQVIKERYELREKFGNNTGRQTWLAQDLESETTELVIVKLLTLGGNIQWDDVRLFEREAQILQQLNHDRIPKYKNYFSLDDSTLWFGLVEEYISGNTLKQLLEKGSRFGEADVINIAQEVLQILVYLHSFNPPILHRDIKPSNLLLGDDDKIYLVDFGAVQDSFSSDGTTFTVVGTYGYTPLEQFGGKTVPASDLYALGITLIHLLTRTSPSNLPNKDLKIQFSDQITVSSQFANWLDQMLAPAVERRFQTAITALKYLSDISGNLSPINQEKGADILLFKGGKNREVDTKKSDLKIESSIKYNYANKPVGSNIKIKQDSDFIEIIIPGQGLNKNNQFIGQLLNNMIMPMTLFIVAEGIIILLIKAWMSLLWRAFALFAIAFIAILLLASSDLRNLFFTTTISCDRNFFLLSIVA